ncbi:MAG: hypothetical protein FWC68_01765 [Oscillospiraceae bacterium]|nr:hypothetical protein [Oscillospiraceae bacterium]
MNYISNSEVKNITTQIRKYLDGASVFEDGLIKQKYLSDELGNPCEYSIDPVPENPIVANHVDGNLLRQFVFNIATKDSYSKEKIRNMLSTTFGQELIDWIIEQNQDEVLPDIDGIEAIEPLLTAHSVETSEEMAKCQIQARIVYLK